MISQPLSEESIENKEQTEKDSESGQWYTDTVLNSELADYAPVKAA